MRDKEERAKDRQKPKAAPDVKLPVLLEREIDSLKRLLAQISQRLDALKTR